MDLDTITYVFQSLDGTFTIKPRLSRRWRVKHDSMPWGDSFAGGEKTAVVDQTAAKAVGSAPEGANKAGALDLIGNVWEWTSSNIKPYPGSKVAFSKPNNFVIRGGSYNSKSSGDRGITSTTRYDVEPTRRDGLLGFRLIRPA